MIIIYNNKIYENLLAQADRIFRHNRHGSYKTRLRYHEAMKRFCRFLAEEFRVEKLANIASKHIYSYVAFMQTVKGYAPSMVKTELSAIRMYHDLMPDPRHKLPENSVLGLERRSFGNVDRTWSVPEFSRMLGEALARNREDYITLLYLARYAALRIHECFRIDTNTARRALENGYIHIKGKGGKWRDVPINDQIRMQSRKLLAVTPRGQKLFVPTNDKTDRAIKRFENFIYTARAKCQDPDSDRPKTFHGLRHNCAAEWYIGYCRKSYTPYKARKAVSELLGHGRDDVTRIYLASVKDGDHYK